MEPAHTRHLIALFNGSAENRLPCLHHITLSYVTAANTDIELRLESPALMADYMQNALHTHSALFRRFDAAHYTAPLVVSLPGDIIGKTGGHRYAVLARLRFFDKTGASELCFDDNFQDGSDELTRRTHAGPRLEDFLSALRAAGDDWTRLTLPGAPRPPHPFMRIVP
jgi:hypothetical protein